MARPAASNRFDVDGENRLAACCRPNIDSAHGIVSIDLVNARMSMAELQERFRDD